VSGWDPQMEAYGRLRDPEGLRRPPEGLQLGTPYGLNRLETPKMGQNLQSDLSDLIVISL
jgi:hypothetical protein